MSWLGLGLALALALTLIPNQEQLEHALLVLAAVVGALGLEIVRALPSGGERGVGSEVRARALAGGRARWTSCDWPP